MYLLVLPLHSNTHITLRSSMEAVIWLENYLSKWKRILLLVSHSQDFLNNVCSNMIHIHHKKLEYYNGNYDTFVKTREDLMVNQLKQYKWEQEQIKSMKEYIAINQSKNSKQAESKRKVLQKMERNGLAVKPEIEKSLNFQFVSATRTFTLSHCNVIIITHLLTLFLSPVGSWTLATPSAGIP